MRRIWFRIALAAWWLSETCEGVGDYAEDKAFIVRSHQESLRTHIRRKHQRTTLG